MADAITKDEQRFDSVETLSKAKSLAESRVKLVRSLYREKRVNDTEFQKIQLLYDEARADVNAGLDRVLVELETTGKKGNVEPYERVAKRAAEKTAEFLNSSDDIMFGKDRGAVETSIKFMDSLVDAFVDIWKVLRGEKTERHKLLMQRMESLKWSDFSEIK